ncbi:sensor histidine kinase [Streptomyces sp. NPDC051662]|uniref:ATP-binding protein n=1 Tax=Streptomyces sp. NPDC051662 TaxID=3154750 RepID=UPI00343A68B8
MSSLIQDAALYVAPVGVASTIAVSVAAVRLRRALGARERDLRQADQWLSTVEGQVAVRDAEALHLAEARLPALVQAVLNGSSDGHAEGELRHSSLVGTPTDHAHRAVLQQVRDLAEGAGDRAEDAARSAVLAVTRSVQALVYEQQGAITHLLATEHDEKVLELVQPIDHTGSQLARRLQILGVLTGMWPGRQRDGAALLDVVRGGVSRIRDYQRVQVPKESAHYVAGRYVEPVVLAVAELLDNAARHSAPSTPVEVSILETHHGISIQIHDAGAGMPPEVREEAELRLSGRREARLTELGALPSFGHFGVGTLAKRYGFRASVDEEHSVHGGVRAVLYLPRALLTAPPETLQQESSAPHHQPPGPGTAAVSAAHQQPQYTIAPDGLPVRERAPGRRAAPAGQQAAPASPEAGQALAAFVQGVASARTPTTDEESTS